MTGHQWWGVVAALGLLALLAAAARAEARDHFTLLVSGASGGAEYAERHARWRSAVVEALRAQPGFRDDHLLVLAETPGPDAGCASREGVRRAVEALRERMDAESVLFVLLLGHGTFDGEDARFNLVGPDLTAADWAALLAPLPGRLVFVNTTAASAPFLAALRGPDRVVITATASPAQRYATVFPEFLSRAFVDAAGDLDRNGRVSVWEAFVHASAGVRRWYQERGRLATERAVLDDTGRGIGVEAGSAEEGPRAGLSAAAYVGAGVDEAAAAAAGGGERGRLAARRAALRTAVEELRAVRTRMDPVRYAAELERILLELAQVSRELRRLDDGR